MSNVAKKQVSREDLDAVAERLRVMFVFELRTRGRPPYCPVKNDDGVWEKVALLCIEHGLDPTMHVAAQMDAEPTFFPHALLRNKAVQRTLQRQQDVDIRASLESQLLVLRGLLTLGRGLPEVLSNPFADFSPAFRYMVARTAGLFALADRFREAARVELACNPKLRQLVGVEEAIAPRCSDAG